MLIEHVFSTVSIYGGSMKKSFIFSYTATVLVKRGTLKPSNILVAGTTWCKVKTMHNSNGISLKEAGPSQPIVVTGWKDLPTAGSYVLQVHDFNNKSKSKDDQQSKNEVFNLTVKRLILVNFQLELFKTFVFKWLIKNNRSYFMVSVL